MKKNDKAVCDYKENYEELYGFEHNNDNDEYRSSANLAGLISEMKTLKTHVSTAMDKVDTFKAQLWHLTSQLERNLERMEEQEAKEQRMKRRKVTDQKKQRKSKS